MLSIRQLANIFSSEQIVAVLLARVYFGTADAAELKQFITGNPIQWNSVYRVLKSHHIRPFAFYVNKKHGMDIFPAGMQRVLTRDFNKCRQKSMKMMIEIGRIVHELKVRGITVIPYKGPVFAQGYFPDFSLRESSDIDFLIDEKDIMAIEDFFVEKKFIRKKSVSRKRLGFYSKIAKDIVYTTPESDSESFSVEMHWRLMDKFSGEYPAYSFFAPHLERFQIQHMALDKLPPTHDFLAVISNHFVKDVSSRFKYLVDVAALLTTSGKLDTELINAAANKYKFNSRLQLGLGLIWHLIGVASDGLLIHNRDVDAVDLQVALQLPPQQQFLSNRDFFNRSIRLQDSYAGKARFVARYLQYIFIRGYVDVTALDIPLSKMLLYMAKAPFKAFGKAKPGHKN